MIHYKRITLRALAARDRDTCIMGLLRPDFEQKRAKPV